MKKLRLLSKLVLIALFVFAISSCKKDDDDCITCTFDDGVSEAQTFCEDGDDWKDEENPVSWDEFVAGMKLVSTFDDEMSCD